MAENLSFDLVSPAQRLAQLVATEVQIPGADGDMTVMADHAPTITTLRPGILRVTHTGGADEYVVSGGFAEITADAVSVLAEKAIAKADVTQDLFDAMVAQAQDAEAKAKEGAGDPGAADDAAKLVADMVAMGAEIGLSAR